VLLLRGSEKSANCDIVTLEGAFTTINRITPVISRKIYQPSSSVVNRDLELRKISRAPTLLWDNATEYVAKFI
jgi:hypothetical protein